MKLSTQEEYGLRCLLNLARRGHRESLTIPEISRAEGLSIANVAKLMRVLRLGGLVQSERGQSGGYTLSRSPEKITIRSVLDVLGGPFYGPAFCNRHSGREESCAHMDDCTLRPLWSKVQIALSEVFERTSLQDLLCSEEEMSRRIESKTGATLPTGADVKQAIGVGDIEAS